MIVDKSMLVPLAVLISVVIAASILISRQIDLGGDHAQELALLHQLERENGEFRVKADSVIRACRLQTSP
jgi:hypothetical protein